MLPTPDTSHVPYQRVYEPAEDSFLLLDTLSSAPEKAFLQTSFPPTSPPPLVLEIGTGSGVVLAFLHAHASTIFGSRQILTAGVDMNVFACRSTVRTVQKAGADNPDTHGMYLGAWTGDLASPWRDNTVDVLVFNPPYVPTPDMPVRPESFDEQDQEREREPDRETSWDDDSYLLSLSYAGGRDGMETTERLVGQLPRILAPRGCAYVLLCAQNKPDEVRRRIGAWGTEWRAEMVASSGKTAGWEKLQVVRIWRDYRDGDGDVPVGDGPVGDGPVGEGGRE
ncbi:S-adenosylmethionine-dependent methyltransferase [Conoideocrella luteorostrata]|uniref:S-adenosylmethionine-dependent methyltransferase n=1 Tax=Conoideocrella luteorostrata TaxID=1105319 RepID=A0AAJ0CDY9_9HYPO|nr:S-adenosylmethionine-dependent methyltransferase [Conoideocrella luteorostrata]